MNSKKLAIVTTHPIQYNAPLFRMLKSRGIVYPKVFYTWSQAREVVEDKGFGHNIKWDIPLLDGYDYEFVNNISRKPSNKSFFGIQSAELIDRINAFAPDAILIFGWNFKSHLDAMRYFKGKIPVWFRGDSHLLNERIGLRIIFRRLFLRWIYSHINKAFFVGIQNKAYHLKHGMKEEQLASAPHAIDNDRFIDGPQKRYGEIAAEKRKELGYKPNDLVVLFAGKFEPIKNPMLLVKAFNNTVLRENNNVKLLMVGSGQLEDSLKTAARGNPNIHFLPFQNQSMMPVIYRVGDVLCLPSKKENWGLVVNEALACGCPVIVSQKAGCLPDIVVNSKVGWTLADPDNILELSEIIRQINPPEVKDDKGKMERQSFIKGWSFESFCAAVEESFEQAHLFSKQRGTKVKLSYFLSHPIQYFSPLLKELDHVFELRVYYFSGDKRNGKFDEGFGKEVKWDIPLLDGYSYHFIKNYSPVKSLNNRLFDLVNPGLIWCLKNDQSTVVVVNGWSYFSSILTIVTAGFMRKKVWLRSENPLNQELRKGVWLRLFKKILLQHILFRFVDKFLYIGQQSKAFFQYYGVSDDRLVFTPYCVNNNYFRQHYIHLKPHKKELVSALGLPESKYIILYVAKYTEKKRPIDLLRAFQLINRSDILLVMVGEGVLRKNMEELIKYERISNVVLTGFVNQSEIVKYYSVADVFVMCSGMGETWGLSVNEAMNFSLPIVITETCGSSYDLVENGVNGFVVKEGNVVELKNKILEVIDNITLRERGGELSWNKVQHYSIGEIVHHLSLASLAT